MTREGAARYQPNMNPLAGDQLLYHLRRLIRWDDCVLSFDFDLIDTLPHILREQYGITGDSDIGHNPDLVAIFELLRARNAGMPGSVRELPALLRKAGVPLNEFVMRAPEGLTGQQANKFDNWSTGSAQDNVSNVIAVQKDLGMGRHNASMQRYEAHRTDTLLKDYLRSVTTAPPSIIERIFRKHFWELKFARWKRTGLLKPCRRSLSVGPRWLTEIAYFREVIGLRRHIGLDLFSDEPELVIAGDMHAMPFPDQHFSFVFIKNTADKSYDIRKLVEELLRVIEPRGLIVIDQVCGYGRCSPLSRTDIQRAANLLRLFQSRARVEPVVCCDVDISGLGDASENNETRRNARLAVQVLEKRQPAEQVGRAAT